MQTGINLLNPTTKPKGKSEIILDWVIVWGKIITLVCAVFLVGVFAYRVYLDTKKNDLEEELEDSYDRFIPYIEYQEKYLKIQNFLNAVDIEVISKEEGVDNSYIYKNYLTDVTVYMYNVSEDGINFEVVVSSLDILKSIEQKMDQDKRITSKKLSIDQDYKSQSSEIKVVGSIVISSEINE